MGTWLGHAAPGTFFICYAVWWLVRSMHSYYSRARDHRYKNSLVQHCCCKGGCLGRLPLDNWVLIFVAALGVVMEVATSMASENSIVMGNKQHLTMYISFGLVGLVSILVHHNFQFMPKGMEYCALIVALIIELVLFRFHLHDRNDGDTHIHMLLVYVITGCIVMVGLEIQYPQSITVLIARCYGFLLQGTWFHQIAVTLYTPLGMSEAELKSPESLMTITLIFSWHMIGCVMVVLILNGMVYLCCSPRCQGEYDDEYSMNLLPVNDSKTKERGNGNSHSVKNEYNSVASDDEEDQIFSASSNTGAS